MEADQQASVVKALHVKMSAQNVHDMRIQNFHVVATLTWQHEDVAEEAVMIMLALGYERIETPFLDLKQKDREGKSSMSALLRKRIVGTRKDSLLLSA